MWKTVLNWALVLVAIGGVLWLVTSSGVLDDSRQTNQSTVTGDAPSTSTTQAPPIAEVTTATTSTTSTTVPENELAAGKGPMHVVIAASESGRAAAETKLSELEAAVGSPTGFTIDQSDHFEGLAGGFWVVIHGAKDKSAADAVVARSTKGSFRPYSRSATKTCEDAIAIES